jgi:hypothetical protein
MTGDAFGRQLECTYQTWSEITLWPSIKSCNTNGVDYSARFQSEKHSFSFTGSSVSKSEINSFYIWASAKVDFIPRDILTEFPNLVGLVVQGCDLQTLKTGLFRPELQRIENLALRSNKIEFIEAQAFQYLVKLKWIDVGNNELATLSYQIFGNNPDLIYIRLNSNKIASIYPNFFDRLQKLKLVDFTEQNICINDKIGCETCSVTQSDLKNKLQGCFDNYCGSDTICQNSYRAQEPTQSKEVIPQTTHSRESQNFNESLRETQMAIEGVKNELSDLKKAVESSVETNKLTQKALQDLKESIAEINTCAKKEEALEQEINGKMEMETQLKDLKAELARMVQEKFDALADRLENNGG